MSWLEMWLEGDLRELWKAREAGEESLLWVVVEVEWKSTAVRKTLVQ